MTAYTPPPPPTDPVRITDQATAVEMTARIIADARHFVWIRSLDLDPWLFDHADVLDALRGFATHGHDTRVLILLHDQAAFADQWMANIAVQQGLNIAEAKESRDE